MWPSLYAKHLPTSSVYQKTLELVKCVLGYDMEFDFDMIIAKVHYRKLNNKIKARGSLKVIEIY